MAGWINLHDIIVLSSNYLGKPVHLYACHMHAKPDSCFLWCGTVLVLCGDTSASQMKAKQFARYVNKQYLLVDKKKARLLRDLDVVILEEQDI